MKHNYVPDGCFLLARQIFESAIWRDDPHVLKLFIYLMGQARHNAKPKKYPSFEIKRGELVTSLAKISEENEYSQNGTIKTWARMKISRMLDLLEKQGYIEKFCDTYGTHISICNYNTYQDMNNYKCDSVVTQVGSKCDTSVTGVLLNNKDNKEENVKKEPKTFLSDSEELRLVDYFISQIKTNKEDFKEPNKQNWAKTFDLMIRRDKRQPREIAELIKWCQNDSFEMTNILCPDKLRQRYDQLIMKMKAKPSTRGMSRTERNTAAKEEFLRKNGLMEKDITPTTEILEAP